MIRPSSADQGGPWLQQDSSVFHLIKHQGFLLLFLGSLSQDLGFPGGPVGKESTCNAGDPGLIPGSGRSPGEEDGNPLQYSCLENPMYRGAQLATVQAKSWTQLSTKFSLLSQNLKSALESCGVLGKQHGESSVGFNSMKRQHLQSVHQYLEVEMAREAEFWACYRGTHLSKPRQ